VYFCPERQGTYFGSFYMKDAPAVGNPGYSIPVTLTAEMGEAFLEALTPDQLPVITGLVEAQKPALYAIVDRREMWLRCCGASWPAKRPTGRRFWP